MDLYAAGMGEMKNVYRFLSSSVKGRKRPLERLDIDGRIILK
jgi:hypothetical protein